MNYEDLQYLAVPLPEDILKEKWSGHFAKARMIIKERLEKGKLPYSMKLRLQLELKNMSIIEQSYTVTKDEAIEQIKEKIPSFTEEEFDKLQLEGKIDYMYIEGDVRYSDSFCATLFKVYPDMWNRSICGDASNYDVLEELVSDLKDGQEIACHIHIRQILEIEKNVLRENQALKVHLPMPIENEHIKNIKVLAIEPDPQKLPEVCEVQPTVYFESETWNREKYVVEYELDNVQKYVDLSKVDLEKIDNAIIPEEENVYLREEYPHIRFSPYLCYLAEEIRGDEKNPLLVARKIYDFITVQTDYRFMREYASVDNLPEYCATNYKGDCGVQALLFITLCRICGIPARWESGLDAKPNDVGEHDWAMFYIPSIGWLYADLSYGGSSYIRGAMKRWNYFFGNVDPYRIPINREFQRQMVPSKKCWRIDPYDNQCGEAEYEDAGLKAEDLVYKYEEIDIHRIK